MLNSLKKWWQNVTKKERKGLLVLMAIFVGMIIFVIGLKLGELLANFL